MALLTVCVAARLSGDDLIDDPALLDMFGEVLRKGVFGATPTETAAFILRNRNGTHRCVLWPDVYEYHAARYSSAIPADTVAIVHTHPRPLPLLSTGDRATAKRIGIPIFAITVNTIYEVTPAGQAIAVRRRRWFDGRSHTQFCRFVPPALLLTRTDDVASARPELDLLEVCGGRIAIAEARELRPCEY